MSAADRPPPDDRVPDQVPAEHTVGSGYPAGSGGYRSGERHTVYQGSDHQGSDPGESKRFDPPGGWAPGDELAESDDFPAPPQPTYRQVGVRLKWPQYQELEHAAQLYGLKPTTLARALINRGTRAILRPIGVRSYSDSRRGRRSPVAVPTGPPRNESAA
jgi:hypothetical protein